MKKEITMHNLDRITLAEGFEQFVDNRVAKNVVPESIHGYRVVYNLFAKHFGENTLLEEIDKNTIPAFIKWRKEINPCVSDATIATYSRNLRAIFYFFMSEGFIGEFSIRIPLATKKLKQIYTTDEIERLLKKPGKGCTFGEYRNWVMVAILIDTGMRLGSLINIKIGDIDFADGTIALHHVKNRREMLIPLSTSLKKIIENYLRVRGNNPDDMLICNSYGEALGKTAVTTAIKRYNKSRGVNKTSVHLFRHTYATNYLKNGGKTTSLKRILGHSTLAMVEEYVQYVITDLQENYDEYSILDKHKDSLEMRERIVKKRK